MSEIIDFQETKAPKFDPNKKYTWATDQDFTLTGGEFGLLLNSLRAVVSTKEAQTIILASKAADLMEDVLAQNVEKGIIKEITE
jgi:hypothetical protein